MRSAAATVPLERVRILDLMGFSCAPGAPNPFVATARGILDGSVTGYGNSPLRSYYESFTPRHVCDLYGFQPAACSALLRERATHAAAPWQKAPGAHMALVRRRINTGDHAQFGRILPPATTAGSIGDRSVQPKRQSNISGSRGSLQSIRTHGYLPEEVGDGHMSGVFA